MVHALEFFGGSPRAVIFDNLKTAVLNERSPQPVSISGVGGNAVMATCSRSPANDAIQNQKGLSRRASAVKQNALAGRAEELTHFDDYLALAVRWRDQVANVRMHETTRERPVDRFQQERSPLCEDYRQSRSTPTKSCRQSSALTCGSNSTAIITRHPRSARPASRNPARRPS